MADVPLFPFNPRWWADPWWEGSEYHVEHSVSLAEIRRPIEALKIVFDESWTQAAIEAGPPNAILAILYAGHGLWPFQDLIWLGNIALALMNVPSRHRPLRSLIGLKTRSALFEMEAASWLSEFGWNVEFLKESTEGKMPDIRISVGDTISAIECKRFESENWEDWAEALCMKLMQKTALDRSTIAPSHDILFEPRLSDLAWGEGPTREGILNELADRISDAVRHAMSTVPPHSVRIPGVAEIRLRLDNPSSQRGMGGIEISPQRKMRRIVTNGILVGAEQLRAYVPGAVVVQADFTPPGELVDIVLSGINRADPCVLSAVAVVAITASLGATPVVWRNPMCSETRLSEVLCNVFKEILFRERRLFRSP